VKFSVRHPSPLNTYSYVREENLGSTRKFIEIYLLFTCKYYQPNSCTKHAEREWAGGTFLRQRKEVPPAHAQWVFWGGEKSGMKSNPLEQRNKYQNGFYCDAI
jgi:hypothetical protein